MSVQKTNIGKRRAANARESSDFYQERQQEVLRAAAQVFEERGFQAATIGDIAEKLGADRASVYYYVSSKTELLQRVVRKATAENVTLIEGIVASNLRASEKLRCVFMAQMENYKSSYPYMQVFLQEKFPVRKHESSAWKRELRQWTDRYFLAFQRILEQGVAEGEMEFSLPLDLTAHALIGMINWAHRWYKPDGSFSAEKIGDGFSEIALKGLLTFKRSTPS